MTAPQTDPLAAHSESWPGESRVPQPRAADTDDLAGRLEAAEAQRDAALEQASRWRAHARDAMARLCSMERQGGAAEIARRWSLLDEEMRASTERVIASFERIMGTGNLGHEKPTKSC